MALSASSPEIKNGINAEMDFGMGSNFKKEKFFMLHPRVGYRFTSRLEAGLMTKFNFNGRASDPFVEIGAYGRYNYLLYNQFRWFVDAQAVWAGGYYIDNWPGASADFKAPREFRHSFTEFGIVPGVAYRIPNTAIDIKVRYLFIGFNKTYNDCPFKDAQGCHTKGDFIFDAGWRRLEIGVSYDF
ncbi:MAG: hypothetical protein NC043_06015 [Muribaculaceae bacterium]|nr:hypothetical protein [Muribaculaceae bacterium]